MADPISVVPPVPISPVTSGAATTEHALAQSSSLWGTIGTLLGAVVAMTPMVDSSSGSKFAVFAGLFISVASMAMKTLTTLGYIKSRTDVKTAASLSQTP